MSVPVGETTTFTATASGRPAPAYRWQRDGIDVPGATSPSFITPPLTAADHGSTYRCVATSSAGTATSNTAAIAISGIGWQGTYFDNQDFSGTRMQRDDLAIDFDWANGAPSGGMGVDTFSVRWRGLVTPAFSQTYTFSASSDDGIRLWVDGRKLIDHWVDGSAAAISGSIDLRAGVPVLVIMEYYEHAGRATARLAWQSASQAMQTIPHTAVVPATAPDLPGDATEPSATSESPDGGCGVGGLAFLLLFAGGMLRTAKRSPPRR